MFRFDGVLKVLLRRLKLSTWSFEHDVSSAADTVYIVAIYRLLLSGSSTSVCVMIHVSVLPSLSGATVHCVVLRRGAARLRIPEERNPFSSLGRGGGGGYFVSRDYQSDADKCLSFLGCCIAMAGKE
jgi:hypothetical protein